MSSAGRPPHEVAAAEPPERLAAALVRNLAESTGGKAVHAVPAERSHVVVESWPAGLSGVADAVGEEPVGSTGGSLFLIAPTKWDDAARSLLRDTAAWLGVAVQLSRLHVDHSAADLRAQRLTAELSSARARLAQVRDLERHRLVRAITETTLRDLDEVRTSLRAADEGRGLAGAENALEELIDDFRSVVRGVFPSMLPDRGPRAALEELAATLPRPVTFAGDLGRRAGWQLESGFYHAVSAVLNLMADHPVTVTFSRDDALRARIEAPAEVDLRLSQDVERLAVLGGEMEAVVDGTTVVAVRLPERVEPVTPAVDPAELERSAIYRKVRDLVRRGQDGSPEWEAIAEQLTAPPLAANAPVIAARRAMVAMRDLVGKLPADHELRWAVEQVAADAHEFAELDLLDELENGRVLRGASAAAARLLGADGIDPRSRLGLPADATDEDVLVAARAAVSGWRAHAEHPVVGRRDRAACEVLVRTAEGLLAPS
ncbi:hypothetical protein [Saccharopolyspora sp. NPDC002686]|uniref:hypothetical protein n=1 Tax=Saccharopolyspora sp. NPDC002686 TaxID=3154541 RepID=UPI0033344003